MYETAISIEDVIALLYNNHTVVSKANVKKAYNFAVEKHNGQTRVSGEPYVMHTLRVAKLLAEWGFGSEVVIAGLLHDTVEDCNVSVEKLSTMFGSNIANLVDAVTQVNRHMKGLEGLSKEEFDRLSDIRLIKNISEESLFIKIADRIDNLYTIDVMSEEKQIKKARDTREILIPMVVKEKAFNLANELEELCFKIEHRELYKKITTAYNRILRANSFQAKKTLSYLSDLFSPKCGDLSDNLLSYAKYMKSFIIEKPYMESIFRKVSDNVGNICNDMDKYLVKDKVVLYHVTIVIDNKVMDNNPSTSLWDIFFEYYSEKLIDRDICICDCRKAHGSESPFMLICDKMKNYYRVFLKTEKDYMRYRLGNIVDNDKQLSFTEVNEIDPRDTYKKKIKVFDENGNARYIDAGATVLDFAFLIHTELGFHFSYAIINNNMAQQGPFVRLNEGDMIKIEHSDEITADIKWFLYCKTAKATYNLVRYFSNIVNK